MLDNFIYYFKKELSFITYNSLIMHTKKFNIHGSTSVSNAT